MADDNTGRTRATGGSIDELLAPLFAAAPEPPTGRIRSLEEARRALRIPTSAEPDVLRAWGTPTDFQLVVYPVAEPNGVDPIAEFAVLRVIKRRGRELIAGGKGTRLRLREKSNALWIVHGSIVQAGDQALVIESLAIGPAFTGQLSDQDDDIAHGVTAQLLRLLSPARLLSSSVERLQQNRFLLEVATRRGAPPISERQGNLHARIEQGRPRQTHVSDDQILEIAKRYITLCSRGFRHPLPQLAREFGITRSQARDRVHKARKQRYLAPARQGRVSAELGPQLKQLGWKPPTFEMTDQIKQDWRAYGQRVLLAMRPEHEDHYAPLSCRIDPRRKVVLRPKPA